MKTLDIKTNRSQTKYNLKEQLLRCLWGIVCPLFFRPSPRIFWGWRRFLLQLFGAKIGKHVQISNTVKIWMPWKFSMGDWSSAGEHVWIYNLGKISIGSKATISPKAHLCAASHDLENPTMPLLKLPIRIGDQAWVCAEAFIGPGVSLEQGSVVGARAVVMKDVEAWSVVTGNPAQFIKKRTLQDARH